MTHLRSTRSFPDTGKEGSIFVVAIAYEICINAFAATIIVNRGRKLSLINYYHCYSLLRTGEVQVEIQVEVVISQKKKKGKKKKAEGNIMENGAVSSEKPQQQEPLQQQGTSSYTYWVREATQDAAPPPVPRKLSPDDILSSQSQPPTLGSAWNRVPYASQKIVSFLLLLLVLI